MAQEKISQLPVEAVSIGSGDFMLISKDIGGGLFESQKIKPEAVVYDSGWKTINAFNGSFGMAATGSVYRPSIRVINRTVYLEGFYVLPMDDGAGALDPNVVNYPSNYYELIHSNGADSFNIGIKGEINTVSPIIPAALFPTVTAMNGQDLIQFLRTYSPTGALGRVRLNTYGTALILPDGTLYIASIETTERNGTTLGLPFWTQSLHLRETASSFNVGDKIMDYSAWRSSFDNLGVDKRVYTDTGDNHDFTHDSSKGANLGGYSFRFAMNWSLDPLLNIDQIKAAFDSI